MAPRRRAARRASVSSTSEEDSMSDSDDLASDDQQSISAPRQRSRRIAHQEPAVGSPRPQRPSRHTARHKIEQTYKEDTTDDEEPVQMLDESAHQAASEPRPKRRKMATPQRSKPVQRSQRPQRRQQPGSARRARTENASPKGPQWHFERHDTAAERRPPFFETLPFQIWTAIFEYASHPLFDPSKPHDMKNRRWLTRACTTCKALLDPAITALYRAPPIANVDAPHELFDLLMTPREDRQTSKAGFDLNYNGKVQRLEFDANNLAYTAHGRGRFDLSRLVPVTPQLHSVRISSVSDIPVHSSSTNYVTNWKYPDTLVSALNDHKRRLRSFEWHQSLCSKWQDLTWLRSVHLTDAFQTITELKLSGFESKEVKKKNAVAYADPGPEERLAEALAALPQLASLEFERCTVLNEALFPLLPRSLQVLHVNDCTYVDSAMLDSFLSAHGSKLKQLILEHNKSLDIRFLPALRSSCPELEFLKIDLNYYSTYRTFVDARPYYVDLLADDDVPSWPSSLRTVELLHLRNWTEAAARSFFKSLVDSADQLPNLRSLTVKAILSVGWRERQALRNEFVPKLERVFRRQAKSPDRHFTSIAEGRAWLDRLRANPKLADAEAVVEISAYRKLPTPPSDDASSSSKRPRLRPRRGHADYLDSSDEETAAPPGSSSATVQGMSSLAIAARMVMEKHVQGMCDVVDVTIDNLRPAEVQWAEDDFLDSEPSGDEEWNPNADDTGELYDGWAA